MDAGPVLFNGVEIANPARLYAYRRYLDPRTSIDCVPCSTIVTGPFTTPAADGAPWYNAARPESARFWGVFVSDFTGYNTAPFSRTSNDRARGGGTFGRRVTKARELGLNLVLHAADCKAMEYGYRWLIAVLSGDLCDGCTIGDHTFWTCCPDTVGATDTRRTLKRVAVIDTIRDITPREADPCVWKEINVVLKAGEPWFYADETTTVLADDLFDISTLQDCIVWCDPYGGWSIMDPLCTDISPTGPGDSTVKITLKAGSAAMSGVEITVTDGACQPDVAAAYSAGNPGTDTQQWLDLAARATDHTGRLGTGTGVDASDPVFRTPDTTVVGQARQYLYYISAAGTDTVGCPDTVPLSIVGDIDVRLDFAADDYTPAGTPALIAKWNTSGNQRSWSLDMLSTGVLRWSWSTAGTAVTVATADSTVSVSTASGVADLGELQIRVTFDVDNGAAGRTVTFYWRAASLGIPLKDNAGWNLIGAAVTTATATSIFDSTAQVQIGTYTGATNTYQGKHFEACVMNGIAGTVVANPKWRDRVQFATPWTSLTDEQGNVWTLVRTAARAPQAVDRAYFDFATDDYVQVSDAADLDAAATDSFWIAALIRSPAQVTSATPRLWNKGGSAAGTAGGELFLGDATAGRPSFAVADGAVRSVVNVPTSVLDNRWHVVIGERIGTAPKTLKATLDQGTPVSATDATTVTLANALEVNIGRISGAANQYDGQIAAIVRGRGTLTNAQRTMIGNPEWAGWANWAANFATTLAVIPVETIPAGATLVIDGSTHSVTVTNSAGVTIGGVEYIADSNGFVQWAEFCDAGCVCVNAPPYQVAVDALVSVTVQNRET